VGRVVPRFFVSGFAFTVMLAASLIVSGASLAAPIKIPLTISYPLLSQALRQALFAQAGRAELWNGNSDCEYLYAEKPFLGQYNGILQLDTDGHLSLGVPVDDRCLSPITWSGTIETAISPYVAGFTLKLHVTDINLYHHDHQKTVLMGRGFDLIKGSLTPALESYSFELGPAIRELEGLAQMAVTPPDEAALHLALASIRLEPNVIRTRSGLQLTMVVDVGSPTGGAQLHASAAPLAAHEIAAWNTALENWDAFLVFAIKQIGTTVSDPKVRNELFDILLDSRQRLVAALGQPLAVNSPDPVRLLFLDEWTRLGQVIETAAENGRLGDRSIEFLSFISVGDALFTLDQAASALHLQISAGDLRRLARIMAPQASGDPLTFSFEEDPQLRQMFDLNAPLEQPGPLELPPDSDAAEPPGRSAEGARDAKDRPAIAPTASDSTANSQNRRGASPLARPSLLANPLSLLPLGLSALAPVPAYSAEIAVGTPPSTLRILALGRRLRAVVVNRRNALTYRSDIGQLLDLTADYQLKNVVLDTSVDGWWPGLLKAAAWQESCWRQFVIKHRRVWYLESSSGDLGLMQINKYVWRGFYSLTRLRWDIVYNASAGSEILRRSLAGSSRRLHSQNPDVLARAAYAAYNGGPNAYDRWRRPEEPPLLRQIDHAFWSKYRAIEEGQAFDILSCAAQSGSPLAD
jgi:Transglycosylase SLT domain